jgi:DNA-binding MarR family transcriptional regulator
MVYLGFDLNIIKISLILIIIYNNWRGDNISSGRYDYQNLTKEQLMFLHLLKFNHQQDDFIVTDLITEQGIKNEINCTLGLVSRILKKNEEIGYIFRTKLKIVKCRRKQNVFFLTENGLIIATEIHKMAKDLKNNNETKNEI